MVNGNVAQIDNENLEIYNFKFGKCSVWTRVRQGCSSVCSAKISRKGVIERYGGMWIG